MLRHAWHEYQHQQGVGVIFQKPVTCHPNKLPWRWMAIALTSGKLQQLLCQERLHCSWKKKNRQEKNSRQVQCGTAGVERITPGDSDPFVDELSGKLIKHRKGKLQGTYFLRCSCSFRNISVLLLLTPEPLLYVLRKGTEIYIKYCRYKTDNKVNQM